MSELGEQARAIVEAGRNADSPSAADHDRIKQAVLVQIAAGGAVASTAVAGTLSLGTKVGLAVLAVSLAGGGAVGMLKARRPSAPAVSAPHSATAALAAPAARPTAALAAAPAPSAAGDQTRRVEKPRRTVPAAGRGEKLEDADQVTAEVEVLKRARAELRLGRPAQALEALVEYDRRFGRGVLGEERQAMAAIAACQATPGPAAQAQAEAFMRKAPVSPLRERVREACITAGRGNSP